MNPYTVAAALFITILSFSASADLVKDIESKGTVNYITEALEQGQSIENIMIELSGALEKNPQLLSQMIQQAVQLFPNESAQIVSVSVNAAPDLAAQIVGAAVTSLPQQAAQMVSAAIIASPDQIEKITQFALSSVTSPEDRTAVKKAAQQAQTLVQAQQPSSQAQPEVQADIEEVATDINANLEPLKEESKPSPLLPPPLKFTPPSRDKPKPVSPSSI